MDIFGASLFSLPLGVLKIKWEAVSPRGLVVDHQVWMGKNNRPFIEHVFCSRNPDRHLPCAISFTYHSNVGNSVQFSSVQSLSCVRPFATPWIAARQDSMSIIISQSSLKLTSIKLVMPSSHPILCHPLFLLPQIPPSIRVFSNESILLMRWPKYWSFSFSIIPSKEHPGPVSFRMDWLDLLAVQGTLKSLLQHHSSKASILQCSAFFTV